MNPFTDFALYFNALNSMFGDVFETYFGYFDADEGMIPPFANEFPAKDISHCFTFASVATKQCNSETECWINLIEAIEEEIERQMSEPRDTSKAAIIWRIRPEVSFYKDFWGGYARFRVLDAQSKRSAYGDPIHYADQIKPFWNVIDA